MASQDGGPQLYHEYTHQSSSIRDQSYIATRNLVLFSRLKETNLKRQKWESNGVGYTAYREFLKSKKVRSSSGAERPPLAQSSERFCVTPPAKSPEMLEKAKKDASNKPSPRRTVGASSPIGISTSFGYSSNSDQPSVINDEFNFSGPFCQFKESPVSVSCLRFARERSDMLAFGSYDGRIRICEISSSPKILHSLNRHTKEITDFDWSIGDSYLCSSSLDKSVIVWDSCSGNCLRIIYGEMAVLAIRFHPVNNNFMLAGTTKEEITVLNFSTGRMGHRLPLENRITALDIDPSGSVMFAGDNLGCIHSVAMDITCALTHAHRNASGLVLSSPVTSVQFKGQSSLAGGPVLLTFSLDGTLRFFSVALEIDGYLSLKCSLPLTPRARMTRASFCPSSKQGREFIVTGSDDHQIYFYDFANPKHPLGGKLQGHNAPVVDVAWNSEEDLLASSDCDGLVVVWKRETKKEDAALPLAVA